MHQQWRAGACGSRVANFSVIRVHAKKLLSSFGMTLSGMIGKRFRMGIGLITGLVIR
jgi:hypothetical protein